MNYTQDPRIVLTLDAGGTNFVFSAMANGQEIVSPLSVPASSETCPTSRVSGEAWP